MKYYLAKFNFWGFTKPSKELTFLIEAKDFTEAHDIMQRKLDHLNSGEQRSPNDRWVATVEEPLTEENTRNLG